MSQRGGTHPGLWALAITAFAIGVTEFIVVGVLPAIASDLDVPLARAGSLVGLYALALAIGTPLVVLTLARMPRRSSHDVISCERPPCMQRMRPPISAVSGMTLNAVCIR